MIEFTHAASIPGMFRDSPLSFVAVMVGRTAVITVGCSKLRFRQSPDARTKMALAFLVSII